MEFYTADGKRAKAHSRVAPRKRQTDPTDLPADKVAFYMRTPRWCREQASRYGTHVYQAINTILTVDTLTHLRQAQGILRFAETYGAERLDAACRRALFFEDCQYRTVKGILEKALDHEPLPCTSGEKEVVCKAHLRGRAAFCTASSEQTPSPATEKEPGEAVSLGIPNTSLVTQENTSCDEAPGGGALGVRMTSEGVINNG